MEPEIIASLLGTLITAIATVIVALIQKPAEKENNSQSLLIVPQGYKTHNPKKRNLWLLVIPFAIVGGIIGYLLGVLFKPSPIPSTPTPRSATQVTQIANISPTPEVTITPQVVYVAVTETTEKNAWMATFPVAGTQIDFAPNLGSGQNADDLSTQYEMSPSPYSGIFLAHSGINRVPTSWEVRFKDGEILPAQTEGCYINLGYPERAQSPLNLIANESSSTVTIFLDSRYSMIVKSVEIFITDYTEPKATSEIEYCPASAQNGILAAML
ncbi:MAG: hypothetical protein HN855_07185 [Anaerolineae bacterium]|jgi:hypothetical protein|nr:hypothetical protein [Anaerolineae bacterium]MBT7069965.1 hypothetical protein [Anaerolineae bacterium]MBT7324923.1 hypothetical protein [Anaerolineae bacterium]